MIHRFLLAVLIILLCTSCTELTTHPEISYEDWISIINIDGSVDTYLQEGRGSCYFIPDPSDNEDEIILVITGSSIYTMSLEGVILNTLFAADEGYSISLIRVSLSHDMSKLVINYLLHDLFLIDLTTSSCIKLPLSDYGYLGTPSFSIDDTKILCSTSNDESKKIIEIDLATHDSEVLYMHSSIYFDFPKWIDSTIVTAIQFDPDSSYEKQLVLLDTCTSEVTIIDSISIYPFDVNVQRGLIAYLSSDNSILKIINKNEVSVENEFSVGHLLSRPPEFSSDGNWLTCGTYLINLATYEITKLDIDLTSSEYTLRYNKDANKLVGTIKSDIPRTPNTGEDDA